MIVDPTQWERVERVLDELLELPVAQREAALHRSCGEDPALKAEVRRLLDADERAGAFLSRPFRWPGESDPEPEPAPLDRVGPFRIVEELGRGGMGVVYLGERIDGQFQQRVALKCVGEGTGVPDIEARFLRERRILADLEHPNIARLVDGGVDQTGRPYFAMEWVDGETITDHCDRLDLDLDRRILLFLDVCRAVEYAHRRLVIHRDLKPANVLVTRDGQVKLLDFGLAKLFDPELSDPSLTATQNRLLTPVYAAPEQLAGQPATTATDVYALGLLLYELVAGRRPFELEGKSAVEFQRDVLEVEPSRPAPAGSAGAADLDAICLRALRKEPDRRYPSVDAMRADLERFRSGRPVEARQGTTGYRISKFIRRHRVESVAAAVIGALVLGGAALSFHQARVAARERERAELINDFFVEEMIGAAAPEAARGRDVSVAEVLDAAARRVETAFVGRPGIEADVRWTLGRTYASLGLHGQSEAQLAVAVQLFGRTAGEHAAETLATRADLAELRSRGGGYDVAIDELQEVLDRQRRLLGADHLDTLRTERLLAGVQVAAGEYLLGQRRLEDVIRRIERHHPTEWREMLSARSGLCAALVIQRRNDEAEKTCRRALEGQRRELGPDHPDALRTEGRLATALDQLDRFDEAVALLEQSLVSHERILGDVHEATLSTMNRLGGVYWGMDRPRDAHRTWSEALERAERGLGPNHQRTLGLTRNVAMASRAIGDVERSVSMYRLALRRFEITLGEGHPRTLKIGRQFADLLLRLGRRDEAEAMLRQVIERSEAVARNPHAEATLLNDYAWFLLSSPIEELQDPTRALEVSRRAVAGTERQHPVFLDTLAHAYWRTGDLDRAIATQREALALPDSLHRYDLERAMVQLLTEAGRLDEVEEFLLAHLERRRAGRPPGDPTIGETLRWLGRHAIARGRHDEGERWLAQATEQFRAGLGDDNWRRCRVLGDLGESYLARGRRREAGDAFRDALECAEANAGRRDDVLETARDRWTRFQAG